MMEDYNEANPLPTRLARFMFLFRSTLPDLYVSTNLYFMIRESIQLKRPTSTRTTLRTKRCRFSRWPRLGSSRSSQRR